MLWEKGEIGESNGSCVWSKDAVYLCENGNKSHYLIKFTYNKLDFSSLWQTPDTDNLRKTEWFQSTVICPLILDGGEAEHCGMGAWRGGGSPFCDCQEADLGSVFLPPASLSPLRSLHWGPRHLSPFSSTLSRNIPRGMLTGFFGHLSIQLS